MSAQRNGSRSTSRSPESRTGGRPKASARALAQLIERSTRVQGPAAEAYVARLRRADPGAGPAEIVAKLEKRYLAALTASGAAVGSTATFPGVGTLTAISAGAGETVFFLEATAVFVLANAAVHGIPADHRERRRALVLAVLVGDDTKRAVGELIGPARTNGGWLAEGMASLPMSTLARLNTRMLKYAVKRYTVKRGALDVRQDAAGRHRRGYRRRRQPHGGQEDRPQRSQRVRPPARALAGNPAPVADRSRGRLAPGYPVYLWRIAGEALAFMGRKRPPSAAGVRYPADRGAQNRRRRATAPAGP